ncbi:MAG: hypothetical protein ACP5LT_04225 [Candidatus Kapaibacteriota bacterium]
MRTLRIFFVMLILYNLTAFAQTDTIKKILISEIEFNQNVKGLNPIKVEAAMNLVTRFSNKFQIIPFDLRDSVARELAIKGIEPTPYNVAKEFAADKILLIKVNRFANILRVEFLSYNLVDNTISNSKGYALIRYFTKDKNEPILDPALLTACQRAFAELVNQPNLFSHLEGNLKVKPAPTLVIGSINYIESDSLTKWDLYLRKQTTSYFAIETIFEVARNSKDFVVFDIASRDSIYSYFNLFEPENFAPPNIEEIKALLNFEVDYYLTGELFWANGATNLKLYLCKITEKGLEIIKETSHFVFDDKMDSYKIAIEKATKELLNIEEE